MNSKALCLIASAAFALPHISFAQTNDTKYCAALSEKYDSLIDTAGSKGGSATPPDVMSAMGKCKSDPASAIPVLEKALKDKRITLPPRT
jgi:hypothetical protein